MRNLIISVLFIFSFSLFAQTRIAILPFSNLDGDYALNKWCYDLQDSLAKAFKELDPEEKEIVIIPADEINTALTNAGVEANSPTFDSDKWKIVPDLKIDKIISGTFRITAKRFLINSYIYYPETQLSDPDFQARDIFKKEEKIMEAIPMIVRQLSKAFIKEKTE